MNKTQRPTSISRSMSKPVHPINSRLWRLHSSQRCSHPLRALRIPSQRSFVWERKGKRRPREERLEHQAQDSQAKYSTV